MTVIDRPARSIEAGVTHDLYRDVHKGIRAELFAATLEAVQILPEVPEVPSGGLP